MLADETDRASDHALVGKDAAVTVHARPSAVRPVLAAAGGHPCKPVARPFVQAPAKPFRQWLIVPCLVVSTSSEAPVLNRYASMLRVRNVRACGSITFSP